MQIGGGRLICFRVLVSTEYVTRVIEYTVSELRLGLLSKICACVASIYNINSIMYIVL
jgi:hypothetical protein